jgi:hypothetical protein
MLMSLDVALDGLTLMIGDNLSEVSNTLVQSSVSEGKQNDNAYL